MSLIHRSKTGYTFVHPEGRGVKGAEQKSELRNPGRAVGTKGEFEPRMNTDGHGFPEVAHWTLERFKIQLRGDEAKAIVELAPGRLRGGGWQLHWGRSGSGCI